MCGPWCAVGERYATPAARCAFKLAFHDADTDTDTDSDSPDTSVHPYIRYARFPREDPREKVRVGVGVRVVAVECQLYNIA